MPAPEEARRPLTRGTVALLLFLSLFALYQANVSVLQEGDTVSTEALPFALLSEGRFSFDPLRFPEFFYWKSRPPFIESDEFSVSRWNERFGEHTAREWLETGHLELAGPRYFLARSTTRDAYVNVFGPIPGLLLLPGAALVHAFAHGAPVDPAVRVQVGKLAASMLVAGTAALLFLVAERRTGRRRGLLVALVYGAATCAWAVSSQNPWQQTVDQALLACAAYFLLEGRERLASTALAGFLLGAAAACRPAAALALVVIAMDTLARDRRRGLVMAAAALPAPAFMFAYNAYYFGSPLVFAQAVVGHSIALEKTGSPALFQTPLLTGALGLLVSPARGLLVHSPVLAAAGWGLVRTFRAARFAEFRPFAGAAIAIMALQCKWFDWWGGHTFGYRPWLDALPYVALLLVPVLERPIHRVAVRAAFGAALVWSVLVQALGAFAYDRSWNFREIHLVEIPGAPRPEVRFGRVAAQRLAAERGGRYIGHVSCDVDEPLCRHRLWSIVDSPLVYYATQFSRTRAARWSLRFRAWTDGN